MDNLDDPASLPWRRFVTSQHYGLQEIYPDEMARATGAFQELLVPEIEAAVADGLLAPGDIQRSAWFVNQLVMATFHHYSFAEDGRPPADLGDQLWNFCYQALGGPGPAGTSTTETSSAETSSTESIKSGLTAATRWATGMVRGYAAEAAACSRNAGTASPSRRSTTGRGSAPTVAGLNTKWRAPAS